MSLSIAIDIIESAVGFPFGSFMDNQEGMFMAMGLMGFFFFQVTFSIEKKGGFFLQSSALLAAALPANDLYAQDGLQRFAHFLVTGPFDRGEWQLACIGLVALALNILLYKERLDRFAR
jgi:hypothetical protein